ncbi:hypothetical protein TIFTF001_016752 [Ficus carica]|uniref:Secreted protein n=1 Tax=Ficus carica TaxID=3494 RepID=A0AA88D7N6_FICCA|nr:hypothetical protein TIFTF001_016752 [Ficus carica]
MSATGTSMLKLVMALAFHANLGDPVGLNSECPRWVDMHQLYGHRTPNGLIPRVPPAMGASDRIGTVTGGVRCQATDAMCCARGLNSGLLMVHNGEYRTNSIVVVQHSSWGRNFGRSISSGQRYTATGSFAPLVNMGLHVLW